VDFRSRECSSIFTVSVITVLSFRPGGILLELEICRLDVVAILWNVPDVAAYS